VRSTAIVLVDSSPKMSAAATSATALRLAPRMRHAGREPSAISLMGIAASTSAKATVSLSLAPRSLNAPTALRRADVTGRSMPTSAMRMPLASRRASHPSKIARSTASRATTRPTAQAAMRTRNGAKRFLRVRRAARALQAIVVKAVTQCPANALNPSTQIPASAPNSPMASSASYVPSVAGREPHQGLAQ
jgi:hypothetical protein